MIRLGKTTKKDGTQILAQAIAYFGPEGLGLEVTRQDDASVYLEGSGGHVSVAVQSQTEQGATDVDIESREWDWHAQQFLGEI
jgi:hypothetical protein